MARSQISIKLDVTTLERVDEAATVLGYTRTAFIERAVNRALENLDGVLEEMEADSPLTAAILDALASKKRLALAVTRAVAKHVPVEQLATGLEAYPKLREEAARRKAARKKGGHK